MRSWLRRDSERPLVVAPGSGQRMCCPSRWRAEASLFWKRSERRAAFRQRRRTNLEAHALYKCLQSDAQRLADLQAGDGLPRYVAAAYEKVQDLRYGENWHQKAALYRKENDLGLTKARKLNGREMSYNNMVDAETVLEMLIDLSEYDGVPVQKPLSIIVKHANPCGVAYGESQRIATGSPLPLIQNPHSVESSASTEPWT